MYIDISKGCKPDVPDSTPDISCCSLVFTKNLLNIESEYKKTTINICLFYILPFPRSDL